MADKQIHPVKPDFLLGHSNKGMFVTYVTTMFPSPRALSQPQQLARADK